jgi:hypothetical protein
MTLKRLLICLAAAVALAGVAFVARDKEAPGETMADAADKFLASLDEKQKAKATFAFDDKERTRYFFTPQQDKERKSTRKGLPLSDMNDKQKEAALALLKTSAGEVGYKKASLVMSLESILHDLEGKGGAMVRDPTWYFVTVFGKPSKTGKWGWRFEGHHLSLNFTLDGGKIVSATPCFYGANPAVVKGGDKKGLETLPESEKPYRDLIALLDDDQKKVAKRDKQFPEIQEAVTKPGVGKPVGLVAKDMNDKQKEALQKLVTGYAGRMHPKVAAAELAEIKKAGWDRVHFAYAGEPAAGKQRTYRVQGPTFVIEYVNTQADSAKNPANHIHSSWRNVNGDFGLE